MPMENMDAFSARTEASGEVYIMVQGTQLGEPFAGTFAPVAQYGKMVMYKKK